MNPEKSSLTVKMSPTPASENASKADWLTYRKTDKNVVWFSITLSRIILFLKIMEMTDSIHMDL